jgi:hypothetical protein
MGQSLGIYVTRYKIMRGKQGFWISDIAIVIGSYGVGSRYQTTGQDTADWED